MSRQRETNPHFRPPPQNQHQHSHSLLPSPGPGEAGTPMPQDHQNQPQIDDQHSQPPRDLRFTQPQPQGPGQHSQQLTSPWFIHPPIQDQQTPVPRSKKPKRQDRRYRPLGLWPVLSQPPRGQQPISPGKPPPQQPQPPGTHPGPQVTQPKPHDQEATIPPPRQPKPHDQEATIPPPRQDHQQEHRRQSHGPLVPEPRRTKLSHWFLAGFCAIFWVIIILGGLIVLIVYLLFRPRNPRFDVSSVTLNAAYLDMGVLLNADLTVLANFTNPNKKVKVDFSYVVLDLYYGKTLIASQYVEPFSAARRTSWFTYVQMVSSQVRLPLAETEQLKKEIDSNAVVFQVKGVFRARSNLGTFLRYSYWLYSHCTVMLTGPPSGVIRAGKCKTKR